MAKAVPLFSGSKGNSYFIGSSGEGVLIDAGKSCKQLEKALELNSINIKSIGGIFITHEHIDHCNGLRVFAKRYGIKVYGSLGTLTALEESGRLDPAINTQVIEDRVAVGNMEVVRCNTSHDARESCCYQVVTADDKRATIATDLGVMTDSVRQIIRESNFAVIESNHDIRMLKLGSYPQSLKQRILSDKGHLSNDACAQELADFVKSGAVRLMLGHISENNNIPALALNTNINELSKAGMKNGIDFTLSTAPPETLGKAVVF